MGALAEALSAAHTKLVANADWRETASITKATLFASACDVLLAIRPTRGSHGGRGNEEFQFDPNALKSARDEAVEFSKSQRIVSENGTYVLSFEGYLD